jgi:hypothetical protein
MLTKLCSKCRTEKAMAQFYPQKGGKHGLHAWCKPCCVDYQRNRRQALGAITRSTPLQAVQPLRGGAAIPIRLDRLVIVSDIPADLTRVEAAHITRILMALAGDNVDSGEP